MLLQSFMWARSFKHFWTFAVLRLVCLSTRGFVLVFDVGCTGDARSTHIAWIKSPADMLFFSEGCSWLPTHVRTHTHRNQKRSRNIFLSFRQIGNNNKEKRHQSTWLWLSTDAIKPLFIFVWQRTWFLFQQLSKWKTQSDSFYEAYVKGSLLQRRQIRSLCDLNKQVSCLLLEQQPSKRG